MNLTYFLLRTFRTAIIVPVVVGLIGGAGSAALIALINVKLGRGGEEAAGPLLPWAFLTLALVVLVTNFFSQLLLVRLAQGASFDLRLRLSREMLSAPLAHLERLGAHRLLATLTEDIPALIAALLSLPPLCINLATLLIFLVYLGWLSPVMLVGLFIFMGVGIGIRQLLVMRGLDSLRLARLESSALMGHYRALTEGAKELKLHRERRRVFIDDVLTGTAQTLRGHTMQGLSIYVAAESWSRLLYYLFLGLVLFAFPLIQPVSAQTLTGYTLIILYVMGPLAGILNLIPTLGRARVALRQIEELKLSLADTREPEPESLPESRAAWSRLELCGVTHSYRTDGDDHSFTLGPIDLGFAPGELVYLVGGNGSGKTTLAKLLTGLYSPEAGTIRLDGETVTDEKREWYRQHFSVVFADFYLFEQLLGVGQEGLDAEARSYLDKLQLAHKVEVRDGVFSTTSLSFGQRKRLALLTAYLEDRPFYVFDEWAAGQDPVFKELFYTQLLPELRGRGKTVLVISHDEKYFHLADRQLKLDYGKLVATPAARISLDSLDALCEV